MVKVRSLSIAKSRFKKRVSIAGPDYEVGVKNPKEPWDSAMEAVKEAIHEGLREAIDKDLIIGGVKRKGHTYWQKRTVSKGPAGPLLTVLFCQ